MDIKSHNFARILLIKPSSLGDIIHALPLLNGLRQRYPRAQISWLVNTQYADLLAQHPQLDEVIPFDRQQFKTLSGAVRMTFKLGGFARELRHRRFDLAIDVQGLFRSGLMALASAAPTRLGFRPAREGAGMFYNCRMPIPDPGMHAVDKNYLAADALGFADLPIAFDLPISPQSRQSLSRKLADAHLKPNRPYAVVVPGSRWPTKNWRPERFSAVIAHLDQHHKLTSVISGDASETALCQHIAQQCPSTPINLAGQIGLSELLALIDGAALVLCNDSAPLHIAVALGKPVVAIFGPTSPERSGPYGRPDSVLQAHLPCMPCYYRKLSQCPIQHQCMSDIDAQQVIQAINDQLGPKPASQTGTRTLLN